MTRSDRSEKETDIDLQSLARSYIDLWEEHVKSLAADPATADAMTRTMQMMTAGAAQLGLAPFADMPGSGGPNNEQGTTDDARRATHAAPFDRSSGGGATTTSSASGGSEPDVRQLALRIGELEERVSDLERELQKNSGKLAAKNRKR